MPVTIARAAAPLYAPIVEEPVSTRERCVLDAMAMDKRRVGHAAEQAGN